MIGGLGGGGYTVSFTSSFGSDYQPQWYDRASSAESAEPVTVTAGADTSGIDAKDQKSYIGGTVRDGDGNPLGGITVRLAATTDSFLGGHDVTTSDGRFSFPARTSIPARTCSTSPRRFLLSTPRSGTTTFTFLSGIRRRVNIAAATPIRFVAGGRDRRRHGETSTSGDDSQGPSPTRAATRSQAYS